MTANSSNEPTDVAANRKGRKWSNRELAGRVAWGIAQVFYRLSPRPMHGFRRMLLRLFGAHIGNNVQLYPSASITIPWNLSIGENSAIGDNVILYALGLVTIGNRVTISQGAHVCAGTHDWRDPAMPLVKTPVTIGDDVWVCADAFVGPGVVIGKHAIVGARAVAMKDVSPGDIVAGNPARVIGKR